MNFKITLSLEKEFYGNTLPLNYQYELSSMIYSTIERSNADYASWLHQNGFELEKKVFKLFCFSQLEIPIYKIIGDRIQINCSKIYWQIAFLPEKSTEEFISGLFRGQSFTLGDKRSKVQFRVSGVELLPFPEINKDTTFKTLSPICITRHLPETGKIFYESPESNYAREALFRNLKNKYSAFYGREFEGSQHFEYEILSQPQSRLITIKASTPQETRIRAYAFKFKLIADVELMKVMWSCGLGEKNSVGFGCVGV